MKGKRWLYLAHRWLGIVLSLVMALWFLSGVVMMYVGYPKLTPLERVQASPVLSAANCCGNPARMLDHLESGGTLRHLRLGMVAGVPRLIARSGTGPVAIDVRSGTPIPPVDATAAGEAARWFAPGGGIETIDRIGEDAWTHSKALDPHRPLFRVVLTHPTLAMLYVSGTTGEVIRDVSITENRWNWIGAWLHWLYPFRGGAIDSWWKDIIIYSALLGTILAVVGIAVGVMRWRGQRYANGSHSPYRKGLMRWHHYAGVFFGFFILAWIASGLFSVNPWGMFDSSAPKPRESTLPIALLRSGFDPAAALGCFTREGDDIRELEWVQRQGQLHAIARDGANRTRVLRDVKTCRMTDMYAMEEVLDEAGRLLPHARIVANTLQETYDWHYYARTPHTMTGGFEKPLPVLVARFDDGHDTRLYLDMQTARLVARNDDYGRVKRVLFNFLHSWDWHLLLDRRPLWDVFLIVASIAGFLVSVTAVILGWKRLGR
jgi:uncharacterized iron-regulated membrane protein